MIKREDVYKIGLFNKPHGIHGELSFTFTDDIFDRADCERKRGADIHRGFGFYVCAGKLLGRCGELCRAGVEIHE